ncbi:flagellar biosynthesis protein FlhF [Parashewanella curva]|uniref:Flagellar biosynthesis protein FlhF n=1 Tax=Parashewanella curva TaxID=2338552 RepID=A0A3L8Q1S2_9GAMM|nr:flagellar biosynthesis protein FlhF [Parashewanella curva]RLV61606.1 flagellar biosynthesis protein FlhF [Parashewanella curva]
MKIKRFFAKDMRSVLAQVKETLGADAVIMSNKKVEDGIEVVAAVDYDEPQPSIAQPATTPTKAKSQSGFRSLLDDKVSLGQNRKPAITEPKKESGSADSLQALLERQHSKLQQQKQQKQEDMELPAWARGMEAAAQKQTKAATFTPSPEKHKVPYTTNNEMQQMRDELASLRNLLTHQVSSLLNEQKQRVDPVGAMLESKLIEAEFSMTIAKQLAELTSDFTPAELVNALPQNLANLLDNQGDDIIKRGGVVALVGPTGVGKTTSLAKIAARFAAKHGSDQVALVTMDHYRIGAYEQLATYGKIMGCPVKLAHDLTELEQILYQFRNRKLILIDTAGMGQRDLRLYQQLDNLAENKRIPIRNYLVLSATSQRRVLQEAVEHFQRVPLAGAILTKLDESVSLAGALSVLVENQLSLGYVTDGQRVPEDMHVADSLKLAEQALSVLDESKPDFVHNTNSNWEVRNNEHY